MIEALRDTAEKTGRPEADIVKDALDRWFAAEGLNTPVFRGIRWKDSFLSRADETSDRCS